METEKCAVAVSWHRDVSSSIGEIAATRGGVGWGLQVVQHGKQD